MKKFSIGLLICIMFAMFISCNNEGVQTPITSQEQTTTNHQTTEVTTESQTTDVTTNVHEHIFSGWVIIKDATCTKEGSKERKCECGYKETTTIHTKNHTAIITNAVSPTCSSEGMTAGKKCMNCGAIIGGCTPIKKLAHTEVVDPAVKATCSSTGKTEGKHCSVCKEVIVEQKTIPVKAHTEAVTPAVKASCVSKGKTAGKHCSVCGKVLVEQQQTPMKNHTEVIDPAAEATCTSNGKTEGKHCSVCGKVLVEQQQTPMKNHTEVIDPAVEATCTSNGKTEGKHCSVCGKVFVEQGTIPMTGRHPIAIMPAITATCTTDGKTEGKQCATCGEIFVEQKTIFAHHEDSDNDYRCDICNETLKLRYSINDDGKSCTITGIGTYIVETVVIPHYIDGYKVTEIDYCMSGAIKSIVIPNTVWRVACRLFDRRIDDVYYNPENVYYEGTYEQFGSVSIRNKNGVSWPTFKDISKMYYYSENRPQTGGLYWHYVNGVPTIW